MVALAQSRSLPAVAAGERFAIYDLGVKVYPAAAFLVQSSGKPIGLGAEMAPLMDTARLWEAVRERGIAVLENSPAEVYLYNWVNGAQGDMVFEVGVAVGDGVAAPPGFVIRRYPALKVASLLYVGPFPHEAGTGWQELRWEERARRNGHVYTEKLYRELYHRFDYSPSGERAHVVEVQIGIE